MTVNLLIFVLIAFSSLVVYGLYIGNRRLYDSEAYRTAKLYLKKDIQVSNIAGEIINFETIRSKEDEIVFEGKKPVKAKYYFVVKGEIKKIEVKLELMNIKNNYWEVSAVDFLKN